MGAHNEMPSVNLTQDMCNRAPQAEPNKEQHCYRHKRERVTHSAIGQQHAWQVIHFDDLCDGGVPWTSLKHVEELLLARL